MTVRLVADRPRIGRPTAEETALQQVEGRFFEVGAELLYGRDNVAAYDRYDAPRDASVHEIAMFARCLAESSDPLARRLSSEILARCAAYDRHDQPADAQVKRAGYRIDQGLVYVRMGCAEIEQTESGRGRGRPSRRPTPAAQPSLLDGAETGGAL